MGDALRTESGRNEPKVVTAYGLRVIRTEPVINNNVRSYKMSSEELEEFNRKYPKSKEEPEKKSPYLNFGFTHYMNIR